MKFQRLEELGIGGTFSDIGRRIYLPDGIFYWSGRAKNEAAINATIGTAMGLESEFIPGGSDRFTACYMPSIIEAVRECDAEKIVNYAPPLGLPEFRKAWKKWIGHKIAARGADPQRMGDPMSVPGATTGVYLMTKLFLSPGEKLLVADKRWENYDLVVQDMQGIGISSFNLFRNGGLDLDGMESAARKIAGLQNKLVVLVNFPNNPTGYSPSEAEIAEMKARIVRLAEDTGKKIVLIFDDAYDGYVFDDSAPKYSAFADFIEAHPNLVLVKLDSASKEMLLYGGRIATISFAYHSSWGDPAPIQKELENKVGALIRGSVSNSPRVTQAAVACALEDMDRVKREQGNVTDVLAARCRAAREALKQVDPALLTADPFNSGFFFLLNVPMDVPADALADRLLKNHKVGVIPGRNEEAGINTLRVAFCSVLEKDIVALIDRIGKAVKE